METKMKWTTDKPTEPGWYWVIDGAHGLGVYQVIEVGGELVAIVFGFAITMCDYNAKWSGPIPMPEDSGESI